MGLAILSRVLNNAGHVCEVYDLAKMGITPDRLTDPQADVVGFTCPTISVQGVKDCIAQLRKVGYKGRIVVGGIHATLYPQTMLDMGADLVVLGECEGNIVQLLESGASGIQQGEKMAIEDIPAPDWDNFWPSVQQYEGQHKILNPRAGVSMWTRGCPYKCIYCMNLLFNGQATRYRPPENIEAEMRYLKGLGIERVYVYDDEMVGTKLPDGWMKEIADRIEPLKMTWITQARCSAKHITADIMRDMRRAGCKMILWGVESFSPDVLKAIKKHTTPEDIWASLKLAKDAGIENSLFMMVGNYKETEQDLAFTAEQLRKVFKQRLANHMQVFATEIMPGTELERLAKAEGWYYPSSGRTASKKVKHSTPWLSIEQVKKWQNALRSACPVGVP